METRLTKTLLFLSNRIYLLWLIIMICIFFFFAKNLFDQNTLFTFLFIAIYIYNTNVDLIVIISIQVVDQMVLFQHGFFHIVEHQRIPLLCKKLAFQLLNAMICKAFLRHSF